MYKKRRSAHSSAHVRCALIAMLCLCAMMCGCSDEQAGEDIAISTARVPREASTNAALTGREKSFPCLACHGAEGISDHDVWPNLAGQTSAYLAKQLRDFRAGERHDPWMSPMAVGLSDRDIDDLAAYFSSLDGVVGGTDSVPAAAQTCVTCHSEQAGATNPLWPFLAGQKQHYLAKQLHDFRAGRRRDPLMAPLASGLSDQDIEALAEVYAHQ